jgi:transcriptional regulator with XRE-family HTH domain
MATEPAIGTKIKRARERQRWTQRQLAAELHVNIKTVDNWENGRTSPLNSIGALEAVLGIRLDGDQIEPDSPSPEELERLRTHIREVSGDGSPLEAAFDALYPENP